MKESNKRALVLSGGGIKGAYQVGVLKKWLKEDGLDYDILCGVSVGALNALKLAAIPLGDSSEAYDNLYNIWHDLTVSRIFCGWKPFGKISALWKWSIFDSSPLIKLIKSDFDIEKIRNSNKNVRIGAVCLNTGEKYFSSENDFNLDEWAVASASLPVIMKPKIINGKWWIDGGIKVSTPIGQAIRLGAKYIDVISCSPGNSYTKEWRPSGRWWSVLDIAYRSLDLMTDRIMAADFHSIGLDNDLVVSKYSDIKIRIIRPSVSLNDDLFNFDSSDISKMIDRGYSDAKNCQ